MKATAVIFSWPPDYLSTAYAVRALVRCGVRVVVVVDEKDPAPAIEGAEVVVTDFPREGNLNGKACVEGILATMDVVARPDDEWVMKVDADALVLRLDWLGLRDEEMVASCYPGQVQYGFCYAVRRDALPGIRARAAVLPASEDCPEDCTIGGLAVTWKRWEHLQPGCPMAAYLWASDRPVGWWKEHYQVLCFQRHLSHGRRGVAKAMKEFLQ